MAYLRRLVSVKHLMPDVDCDDVCLGNSVRFGGGGAKVFILCSLVDLK